MPEGARVDSLETLTAFKAALWKFQEAAQMALGDAESDVNRMLMWVQNEQDSFWQGQIRKGQEAVGRAKEAVRMKKVFKDASGRQQSAVDEEKALQIAQKRLAAAEAKLVLVRRWSRQLQKEMEMYKGGVQRFATSIQSEIPNAAAHLEKLAAKLDAYLSVQPAAGGSAAGAGVTGSSSGAPAMSRGGVGAGTAGGEAAPLQIPVVSKEQRAAIAALPVERDVPADELPVRFATPGAAPLSFLRLVRDEEGWALSSLGDASPVFAPPVRAADLLRDRPDLSELMSLPVGISVIIGTSGIAEILDPRRQTLWRATGTDDAARQGTA